jgi:hypothetical protein
MEKIQIDQTPYEEWLELNEQLDLLLVETQCAEIKGDLIECGLLPVYPHRLPDLDLLDWDEWGDNLH